MIVERSTYHQGMFVINGAPAIDVPVDLSPLERRVVPVLITDWNNVLMRG